jgi:hypothetical protein
LQLDAVKKILGPIPPPYQDYFPWEYRFARLPQWEYNDSGGGVMETRFIADAMLGKLARWMRVLGCDVEYFPSIGDRELVELAAGSGRLILTRDTLLVRRRGARSNHFFVEGDDFRSQLRQVVERFAIDPSALFLTRCLACNTLLAEIGKGAVRERVPPYIHETQAEFRICPTCGRIYWQGTHRERMAREIAEILKPGP